MDKKSGFTLLEVMIVIAIFGLLTAIAIPNYIIYRNNRQVALSARAVYDALQLAKTRAIRDNTTVNVQFTPGSGKAGKYRVFVDLDGNGSFSPGDTEIASGSMAPGVALQRVSFAGISDSARFNSIGLTTGANGTVVVGNGNRTIKIIVNSAGGIRMD